MSIADVKPLSQAEIRLKCLQLAHRATLTPEQVIADARTYLSWVGGAIPITDDNQPGDDSKASKVTAPRSRTSSPNL